MAFNLPNILTWLRIWLIPLFVAVFYLPHAWLHEHTANVIGTALFALASVTDWLDGWLARKWGVVTVLGKFLDPLADKLIVMAALVMLIPLGRVPAWAVFVILAREMVVTGLRSIASSEGVVIAASDLGKYKTIFQMVAIIGLLLHYNYYWFFGVQWEILRVNMQHAGIFFFYIALFITIWSGADYLVKFFKVIAK